MTVLKRVMRSAGALLLVAGVAACGDDGPTGPTPIPLEEVQGLYEITSMTFDPQGSAQAGDVLAAFEAAGVTPELNISQARTFQLFFRDPGTGNVETLSGTVRTLIDQIELVFPSQAEADEFLLPRVLTLNWDGEDETLSYSAGTTVNRERLLELFPELYAEEQFVSPTPGTLTVTFDRTP